MRNSPDTSRRDLDRNDDYVNCSECGTFMLPLKDYDMDKASEAPAVGANLFEFLIWGWMAFVYNYLYDLLTLEGRKKKLAEQKRDILPTAPNTLVCPRCLGIIKR